MEHLEPLVNYIPSAIAIGKWLAPLCSRVLRRKHEFAPESVRQRAEENAKPTIEMLADRMVVLAQRNGALEEVQRQNVNSVSGYSVIVRTIEAAGEIDDPDVQSALANLVAQRLSSTPRSSLQLATALAIDTLPYLNNRHLMILALKASLQGMKPGDRDDQPWTDVVCNWFRSYLPKVMVADPTFAEIDLLVGSGLMYVEGTHHPTLASRKLRNNGESPNLTEFLRDDPIGREVQRLDKHLGAYHLNIAGVMLGVVCAEQLTGVPTDLSVFSD